MQKGDKARVIKDCEVKAGSEVEVVGFDEIDPWNIVCYFNGIRVEIAESNLEVIKPERIKPSKDKRYFFINSMFKTESMYWNDTNLDVARFKVGNCFNTKEESDAMLAKIQALVTSEIGDC